VAVNNIGKDAVMNKRGAFTLIELLVVISVIALLMAILFPVLGRAREAGKRTVCLSNLKTLQLAWGMYADNNNEKIVNGQAGFDNSESIRGPSWTGSYLEGTLINMEGNEIKNKIELNQILCIQSGVLYPYVRNLKVYHCPNGFRKYIRTYSIVDSMNAGHHDTILNFKNTIIDEHNYSDWLKWLHSIKNRLQIKNPASRIVFIDEGMPLHTFFSIAYDNESWGMESPCRHIDGNTFSFVDGHAEFWKWQGKDTIVNGLSVYPDELVPNRSIIKKPTTNGGFKDLHKTQIAVWGGLGYAPTPTE
jgi:prepilin-type N-terminal cleavage/methylation domain-containing protein